MTDILLLGTFHFAESDRDFYTPEAQKELHEIAQALLRFSPDAVAVEAAAHQQEAISAAYRKFELSDLQDFEKMKTESLGTIHTFGQTGPIRYGKECVQLGFRIAKQQGLPDVYAIDDDSTLQMDGEIAEHPSPALSKLMTQMSESEAYHDKNDTLTELFRYNNTTEWSRRNHMLYMLINEMGDSDNYMGVQPLAQWYTRKLKIFSSIQRLAQTHKRIFAIYGAGHLQILRDLICADDRLHLADVMSYLPGSQTSK